MVHFNFAVVANPPSVTDCWTDPANCPKPGFGIEMVQLACETLKWNCTFFPAGTRAYGYVENGTWHGVVGLIKDGLFDLSLPRFAPTSDRFEVVDFSSAFFFDNMLLVTRNTANMSANESLDLIGPFKWQVWLCVAAVVFFAANFLRDTIITHRSKAVVETLFERCASRFTTHCIRFCIGLLSFSALVLLRSYTGYIFSRSVPFYGAPPFTDLKSFIECLEKNRCSLATTAPTEGYLKDTLEGEQSVLLRRMRTALEKRPVRVVWPPEDMLSTILEDDSHFMTGFIWGSDFYYAAGLKRCQFHVLPGAFIEAPRTIPMRKHSPVSIHLNVLADVLWETGISKRILRNYYLVGECPNIRQPLQAPSLHYLVGIFIFYGAGMLLAITFFLFEVTFPLLRGT